MAGQFGDDLELRRILSVGTFGRVKLVLHKPINTVYAFKCMRKQQVVATEQQSHVLSERILAAIDHFRSLKLVATYQDKGELMMLLELGLGGEIFSLLAKKAPLPDARFYYSARHKKKSDVGTDCRIQKSSLSNSTTPTCLYWSI